MRPTIRWKQAVMPGLVALSLAGTGGCLSFLNPVPEPQPELLGSCQSLAPCCRDHVHVFLLNGLDPFHCGNMPGLRDYIQQLGFRQTYYGELYHYWLVKSQVRQIHQDDPNARFVLIGFSLGGCEANLLADSLNTEGIRISLLVYLDAKSFTANLTHKPDNVDRVVNILCMGSLWDGTEQGEAENLREQEVWHFGAPTHPQTLGTLAGALASVAQAVPVTEPAKEPGSPAEEAPTPHPVKPQASAQRDEWDFLKPEPSLKYGPPVQEVHSTEPAYPGSTTIAADTK